MKPAPLLFLFLLLALAAPGVASAEHEPNNGLWQAEGPIAGGVDIQGALTTQDDTDWYVFYAKPQQQLHVSGKDLSAGGSGLDTNCFDFVDTDGNALPYDYTTPAGPERRYFIAVHTDWDCFTDSYSVRVDPAIAISTGPALPSPVPTGEPNENDAQAGGPLLGGTTYTGTLDTSNDEDWLYFYTAPGTHQLDLAVTGVSECSPTVQLVDPGVDPGDVDGVSASDNQVEHITRTVTGRHRLAVRVSGDGWSSCVGESWQFRIGPAGAVGSAPPSCDPEQARYQAAEAVVVRARNALRRAHGRRARLTAKRKLRAALAKERRTGDSLAACEEA